MEEALEWRQLSLLEHGHLLDHVLEDVSLGCITETMAGDLLHRDQADVLFPVGVEGLVERRILIEPGMILEHDGIDNSPKSGRLDDLGPVLVMRRETDESKTHGDTLGGRVGLCQRFSLHRERLTRESDAR